METNKDKQLQRRVQSLQRFLMTRLKAELAQRAPAQPTDQGKPALGTEDRVDAGNPCHLSISRIAHSMAAQVFVPMCVAASCAVL